MSDAIEIRNPRSDHTGDTIPLVVEQEHDMIVCIMAAIITTSRVGMSAEHAVKTAREIVALVYEKAP